MKTWNRLISLVLTGAILLAVPLTSFATGANNRIKVVSKTKSSQFQVATVEVDGKTIIAEYDSSSKQMIITTKSGSNIEEVLHIDPNKSQYSQDVYGEPAVDVLSNEQAGKYRVGYQHTITDYEYEEWKYPNYNHGKGFFWYLKKPNTAQHSCYEISRGSSEYSSSIDGYVEAVETINSQEIIIGASAAVTVAGILLTGGTSAVIQGKIVAALEAVGVVGAVTIAQTYWSATQKCERHWKELFG